jgi:ferrous iron transport protein A
VIAALGGGAGAARRLRDLGLTERREFAVVRQREAGGVPVGVGDGRPALDTETAARVRAAVDPAPPRRSWDLKPGDRARVRGLREGAPADRAKLLAMGLLPGTIVEVLGMAPLGDPVEPRVRGYRLRPRASPGICWRRPPGSSPCRRRSASWSPPCSVPDALRRRSPPAISRAPAEG